MKTKITLFTIVFAVFLGNIINGQTNDIFKTGILAIDEGLNEPLLVKKLDLSWITQLKNEGHIGNKQLTTLPKEILQFKNLSELDIADNRIKNLPDAIGQLTKIEVLHYEFNDLTEFPMNILKLKNLRMLYLYGNSLTSLPEKISSLNKLEYISLDVNTFTRKERRRIKKMLPNCRFSLGF